MGDLEMREGDAPAAVDAYAQALKLMPQAKHLHSHYGAALVTAGRYAPGLAELETALKDDPSDVNARFDLGKALANNGKEADRSRAMKELNRVVQFSENKSRAYMEAGRLWLREGEHNNAIPFLESANELSPYNVDVLTLLTKACIDDNRQAEAQRMRKALDDAQQLSAEHTKILSDLESGTDLVGNLLLLGRLDRSMQNLLEAQSAFEAAAYLEPDNLQAKRELKSLAAK